MTYKEFKDSFYSKKPNEVVKYKTFYWENGKMTFKESEILVLEKDNGIELFIHVPNNFKLCKLTKDNFVEEYVIK